MPVPKHQSSVSFSDVAPIMHQAAQAGGVRFRVESYNRAVNFRQRCYRWRKRQQELAQSKLGEVPGLEASTPYDAFQIVIEDPLGRRINNKRQIRADASSFFDVVIEPIEAVGELLSLDGKPISLRREDLEAEDDWLEEGDE